MPETTPVVSFRYDAPELSAPEFARAFSEAVEARPTGIDAYSLGGAVERLEEAFARKLGKERAIFMPTGTLANHLAVRALARGKSRVLVQERGHLYNDSGDCLQRLSGLNAVPLGRGAAGFGLAEVEAAFESAASARVEAGIGAIVVETPVRRMHGALFRQSDMDEVCAFGRARGVGLHLDGARIFIASAYSGIPVEDYAARFDTVYVSLYKYFGSPSGAVLAGPARLIDGLYHERRMFGGGLNQAWPFAAMALDALDAFPERFARAVESSETLKAALAEIAGLSVSSVPSGTNVFGLGLGSGVDPAAFRERLSRAGIALPAPEAGTFHLKVNTSILALEPSEIAGRLAGAARP